MHVNELLKNGKHVDTIADIPLNEDGMYFIQYRNSNRFGETAQGKYEYALYDVSSKLGVVNNQFHFDVADNYIDVTYVKLKGVNTTH